MPNDTTRSGHKWVRVAGVLTALDGQIPSANIVTIMGSRMSGIDR
jgi:hypothetical protein